MFDKLFKFFIGISVICSVVMSIAVFALVVVGIIAAIKYIGGGA